MEVPVIPNFDGTVIFLPVVRGELTPASQVAATSG